MTPVVRLLLIGGQGLVRAPHKEPHVFRCRSLILSFLASIQLPDFVLELEQVSLNIYRDGTAYQTTTVDTGVADPTALLLIGAGMPRVVLSNGSSVRHTDFACP